MGWLKGAIQFLVRLAKVARGASEWQFRARSGSKWWVCSSPPTSLRVVLIALLFAASVRGEIPEGKESSDKTLARIPPKSTEQALATFEVAEGFELELVAAEPLLADPIAIAFDPQGRMLVVEMIDYSEQATEKLGRISRLTDTDQDGRMDQSEVLGSGISWPTALGITEKGIVVVHPPKMSLIREIKTQEATKFIIEELFDGFARNNVQGMANSFHWGLDQRLHLSTSSNGASLTGLGLVKTLELRGRDVGFDPLSWKTFDEPGGGQHGMDFNPWGDKFISSNSDHLQQIVAWNEPWIQEARNSDSPAWKRSIAVDGPQADVYRLSPVEGWREWRTQLRTAQGINGPIEGGGRPAGYFTGATGVVIYDGDQWYAKGEQVDPIAIVADVGGNLVHRKKLIQNQLQWKGYRIDEKSEFVRSSDLWFRPVQFSDGPDGCLYIVDMYREVIEHPLSLPEPIKSQLDLTSGRDRGRVWRIKRKDLPVRRSIESLSSMSPDKLVSQIAHRNGWHRETASRLIYERQLIDAIAPLRAMVKNGEFAESRLQALATLRSLPGGVDVPTLLIGLRDEHPRVRQHAVQLLDQFDPSDSDSASIKAILPSLLSDKSLYVRFSLAGRMGRWEMEDESRAKSLRALIGEDWNCDELRFAVEHAMGKGSRSLLLAILSEPKLEAPKLRWLQSCMFKIAQQDGFEKLLSVIDDACKTNSDRTTPLLSALGGYVRKVQGSLSSSDRSLLAVWSMNHGVSALEDLLSGKSDQALDAASICVLLAGVDSEVKTKWMGKILQKETAINLQQSAIQAWLANDIELAKYVLERHDQLVPEVHSELLRSLARRSELCDLLFQSLNENKVTASQVPTDVWTLLEQQKPDQKERLRELRGTSSNAVWESIAERYKAAWRESPDLSRGKDLFKKHCAACHKLGGLGNEIGPGLASILSKSNEQIALSIVEPSREVDPKYQVYQLQTLDGELIVGILEESNAASITVRDNRGERRSVQRSDVDSFSTSGKSLMPEGLIEQIDPTALNDLIGFLRNGG